MLIIFRVRIVMIAKDTPFESLSVVFIYDATIIDYLSLHTLNVHSLYSSHHTINLSMYLLFIIFVYITSIFLRQMMQPEKVNNTIAVHEFQIEIDLLSRIDHPNVVKILGCGVLPRPFIVLERLNSLSGLLNLEGNVEARPSIFSKRAFTYEQFLKIAKDLSDALVYLHNTFHPEAMIIHRDLKPDNMGLANDGTLKLFDFGLCRCVKKRNNLDETYTMTGNTGSQRYMAPEVVLEKSYNEMVDVFSFGMVIWAIASNKQPYKGYDRDMHRTRVIRGGERPKLSSSWPPAFCKLLSDCWHRDSHQRPNFECISNRLQELWSAENGYQSKKNSSIFKRLSMSGLLKR